jgi:hypothetical protein
LVVWASQQFIQSDTVAVKGADVISAIPDNLLKNQGRI